MVGTRKNSVSEIHYVFSDRRRKNTIVSKSFIMLWVSSLSKCLFKGRKKKSSLKFLRWFLFQRIDDRMAEHWCQISYLKFKVKKIVLFLFRHMSLFDAKRIRKWHRNKIQLVDSFQSDWYLWTKKKRTTIILSKYSTVRRECSTNSSLHAFFILDRKKFSSTCD